MVREFIKQVCADCGHKDTYAWSGEEPLCIQCKRNRELKLRKDALARGEELNTYSTNGAICPYCGDMIEDDLFEYDWGYGDGEYKQECFECERTFIVEPYVSVSYETRKDDGND